LVIECEADDEAALPDGTRLIDGIKNAGVHTRLAEALGCGVHGVLPRIEDFPDLFDGLAAENGYAAEDRYVVVRK
jgi:hypothetical protein